MKTKSYKTKTFFKDRENPVFSEGNRPIALDIGYSAVKGFSPNMVYCFPAYAMELDEMPAIVGTPEAKEIFYRDDDTGALWIVGAGAQNMLSSSSVNDNVITLYGRNRYYSEMFKVISRTGIAFGLLKQGTVVNYGTLEIQTGLPPAYIKGDAPFLKDVLAKTHSFSLKVGGFDWQSFQFTLTEKQIHIMPQPMGTLMSICTDKNGKATPESVKLYKSSLLIMDPGFGTFDTFHIRNNKAAWKDSASNLGMKQVFQNTCDTIFKEYGVEISVPAIQPLLEAGEFKKIVRSSDGRMKSMQYPFDEILERESQKVCMQAIEHMNQTYNNFVDMDCLVITGGTGAAWSNYIREYFEDMNTLTIISGNANDDLPHIFSNVRGYYMSLINYLKVA